MIDFDDNTNTWINYFIESIESNAIHIMMAGIGAKSTPQIPPTLSGGPPKAAGSGSQILNLPQLLPQYVWAQDKHQLPTTPYQIRLPYDPSFSSTTKLRSFFF